MMLLGRSVKPLTSTYNSRPQAVEILVDGAKAHLIKARADFADLWRLERLLPQD